MRTSRSTTIPLWVLLGGRLRLPIRLTFQLGVVSHRRPAARVLVKVSQSTLIANHISGSMTRTHLLREPVQRGYEQN